MRVLGRIAFVALIIVVQLFLVMQFTCPPMNLAKMPYRRAERAAAAQALARNRSPENEAAFKQELRLESRDLSMQQFTLTGVVLVAILSFEVWLYLGRKQNDKSKAVVEHPMERGQPGIIANLPAHIARWEGLRKM
jgi:hypothetical protein